MRDSALATARIERFLSALANLADDVAAVMAFVRRFGDMLADLPSAHEWCKGSRRHPGRVIQTSPEAEESIRIGDLKAHVMSIWRGPTSLEKEFRLLFLHRAISARKPTFLLARDVVRHLSPLGAFEQAILHLFKSADRALVCGNPECPAPLFFRSRTKRRQRYCSPKCSGFGQREAKRKWWADHGQQWRENQKNEKKRKRGGKHGTGKTR